MSSVEAKKLSTVERINFGSEAVVARHLTQNSDGAFIDSVSGRKAHGLLRRFSLMKYGHLASTRYFAHEIARASFLSPDFLQFLTDAAYDGKTTFITSPGIFNVPSASNLLLRETAALLNNYCSKNGLPPIKLLEQTRLGESTLNYAQRTIDDRAKDQATRSVLPELFRNSAVIYLDDVYISGTVAERAKQRLITEANASSVHFLFGMRVDPELVRASNGTVEEVLNKYAVDGTLAGLSQVLKSEFTPTQKTLRDLFALENRSGLPAFLDTLDRKAIYSLYIAAVQNGFRERWDGQFRDSVDILESKLKAVGYLDQKGLVVSDADRIIFKEIETQKLWGKHALWHLDDVHDISDEEAQLYSRMKYSDPEAVAQMAANLFESIWSNQTLRERLLAEDEVVISSSAYGAVPTAAACLVDHLVSKLVAAGIKATKFKIDWQGDFSVTQYGSMTPEERAACLDGYQTYISAENAQRIAGKFALIIDDLSATGSHEKLLAKLLEKTQVKEYAFCCLVDFSSQLAYEAADTEEKLNHYQVKDLNDLATIYQRAIANGQAIEFNTRTLRFVLNFANNDEVQYLSFLDSLSHEDKLKLFEGAVSSDGYSKLPKFIKGIQILENQLLSVDNSLIERVNKRRNRTSAYLVTLTEEGKLLDLRSGEDLTEVGKKYSLMKFGSAKDIDFFARRMATIFINRLNDSEDGLSEALQAIKQRGEYLVNLVAGSRNVDHAAKMVYEKAITYINMELSLRSLPTLISLVPTRLEAISGNYAAMSTNDRRGLPGVSDHILPGKELYQFGVHLFFGDDVRITGSTADAVERSAVGNGAKSFSDMYLFMVDTKIALNDPLVEDRLNRLAVSGRLDQNITYILNQPEFEPVQRLLRIVFSPQNLESLHQFLQNISTSSLMKLYQAALSNDYLADARFASSVKVLSQVLQEQSLIDANGRVNLS